MANRKKTDGEGRVVYSTDPDFSIDDQEQDEQISLPGSEQQLKVRLDSHSRKGKTVTLVEGFRGTEEDRQALGKLLRTRCGTGGSAKEGLILVQGDFLLRVKEILIQLGYKV